ncbi:EAL domain-containing protein [Thalassotalea aquiviva]|uniref:sensor domain-containing phosphodiesterase n=1 Tax=Thalassotalea aquiviva TaxID=3242415 RepID=UPI00352AA87C
MTDYQQQFYQLQQQHRQLEYMHSALHKITDLAYHCQSLNDFYHQLHQTVASLIDAKNFFVALINHETERLDFVFHQDQKDQCPSSQTQEDIEGSLSALVLKRKKPLLVTPKKDKRLMAKGLVQLRGSAGVDWLGVPLLKDGEVLGLMVVQSYSNNVRYQKRDSVFLEFVASHVITALDRLKSKDALQKAVQQRTQELEQKLTIIRQNERLKQVLFDISELTSTQLDMGLFYQGLHQIIGQLVSVENFFIARFEQSKNRVRFEYYVDSMTPDLNQHKRQTSHKGFTEYLIEQNKPLLLTRDHMQMLVAQGKVNHTQIQAYSWLGLPLKQNDQIVGAMVVQSYQADIVYSDKELELLTFVSHHVSTALLRKEAADYLQKSQNWLEATVNQRTAALREEIAQRQRIEEELKYSATHDALTGLRNRSFFYEQLNSKIAKQHVDGAYGFAILFIDLDHFKKVNDSLGHHIGDLLLKQVAEHIEPFIQQQDTIARLGGDEFAIILDNLDDFNAPINVAKRIIKELEQTFYINTSRIHIGASIGILFSDKRYQVAEEMLRDADTAMYQAKDKGKGRCEIYDAHMHQALLASIQLEADIIDGINKGEFLPDFQPIFDLTSNQIIGYEALARWHNKQKIIMPDDFIEVAEDTLLIEKIDLQILDKAAQAVGTWRRLNPESALYVCCNLFSSHFLKSDIVPQIQDIMLRHQLPLGALAIELTERVLIENNSTVLANMTALKNIGVRLFLDDFGTGYSSLSYLYRYPFDVLKIDSSFINNLCRSKKHTVIVKTIIEMAKNLGMETVAEGLEFEHECQILKDMQCPYGQGYYLSPPQSYQQVLTFLKSNTIEA